MQQATNVVVVVGVFYDVIDGTDCDLWNEPKLNKLIFP
jgi:hypothetical protein